MAFSAADVKNLREMTGVGMMDCKKALTAADGDIDKAVEWLREKGLAAAQKKAGRIAAEGMAYAVDIDGIGVIIEVNAESDFVAKNDLFVEYVKGVAAVIAKENPADLDALYACAYGNGKTVLEEQNDKVLVIGENIKVRRFARYDTGPMSTWAAVSPCSSTSRPSPPTLLSSSSARISLCRSRL